MEKQKLVSVLIPVYNVEKYLLEAVESIMNQTYKNLEIIIVDDNSTDNTLEIALKLSKNDSRIKVLTNKTNKKICYTLNKAYKISKGEYIARMDGDDISELDRIERQMNYLENNQDIDLVGTSTIAIDENGKELSRVKFLEKFKDLEKIIKVTTPVSHIWVARREVYDKLQGYREIPYVEDYDFLLRMLTSGFKFANISDYYGYKVRIRNGNTVTSVGVKQRKAFDYSLNLYLERIKYKKDSYSYEKYLKIIESTSLEEIRYINSYKKLEKAIKIKNKNILKSAYLVLLSISLCKYNRKYILNRILYKIIKLCVQIGEKY